MTTGPLRIEPRIIKLVDRLYAPPGVRVSQSTTLFTDLKLTDSQLISLIVDTEAEFNCTIPGDWIPSLGTIGGLVAMVARLKSA